MGKRGKMPTMKLPVAKSSTSPPVSNIAPGSVDNDMRWRAEDALRDIERAEKHKSDSQLMKHVGKLAEEKMTALKKICK